MWESGLWLYYILYRNTHFVHESENSKVTAGTGEDQTGWKRRGGRKKSCRQDYWTAMDVETGNRWERKCAESREQELWQEGGSTGLEPPYDSRWGDEEEWEMGVENLTERERELWEKVWIQAMGKMKSRKDCRRDWYRPVERSEMESDKEKRRNVVCATTAGASQVMIVLSSNRRYRHTHTHTFWKALIWKCFISEDEHPQCMFIVVMHHLSVLSLSSVFPSSTSFFIPLCVHWGVTNWWFSGLKEAQMEKQMERVIGHVYAFYLRFPPPFFFSLPHSLTLSFVPPFSLL